MAVDEELLDRWVRQLRASSWLDPATASGSLPKVPTTTLGTLPTATADYRGRVIMVYGAAGVADAFYVCVKSAADTYSWVALPGADLSAIDFLVGTATTALSAEIVVGTTPGGELGGTWASPTVDATHSGSAHSSLAPVGADYLVGTANGTLTAEIVVGTSPGGELGGTWASPTVDATHSGSAHASAMQEALLEVAVPGGTTALATYGGANWATLMPIVPLTADVTVTTLRAVVGVQSGNVDVGIYSTADGATFTRVVSMGSTACPATGQWTANIADTALTRGTRYFFGFACDNVTASFQMVNASSPTSGYSHTFAAGKTASFPLPTTLSSLNISSMNPIVVAGNISGAFASI